MSMAYPCTMIAARLQRRADAWGSIARRAVGAGPARKQGRAMVLAQSKRTRARASSSPEYFTVTTPLFYANAAPHMGSAYPTMAADALARYHRLRGRPVRFVTGTDEHGEKIAESAKSADKSPKQHCDEIVEQYKELWKSLDIAYDRFVRTTDEDHEQVVKEFMERVWERGDIYLDSYSGYYCVGCEEFKDEKELEEGQVCPIHRKECQLRSEENYFFRLSAYQKDIEKLLEENPDFVCPESRRNEVMGWVKEGLRDFSISRANVKWGIPVPRDPDQTIYVWFDALLGYVSSLVGKQGLDSAEQNYWPANVHIIGKDILRFHAIYWPAMLLSGGFALPKQIFGHGLLTKDGMKMGKSLGNTIDPFELANSYGADAVRFYFLQAMEFGKDGDFSLERFIQSVNSDLANDIGNLLNRSLGLLKKRCNFELRKSAAEIDENHPMRLVVSRQVALVENAYETCSLQDACVHALEITRECNRFFDKAEPWKTLKSEDTFEEAADSLLVALEAVRITAVLLKPITPSLSERIFIQLGYSDEEIALVSWENAKWGELGVSRKPSPPSPVFQRLEMPEVMSVQ